MLFRSGYMVDVYRGDIEPEKNLLKQIRGIGRQNAKDLFQYDRIASGLLLMLWGFFQKLVIADRLCVFVDAVDADWQLLVPVDGNYNFVFIYFSVRDVWPGL